jgi:hypothetical protein
MITMENLCQENSNSFWKNMESTTKLLHLIHCSRMVWQRGSIVPLWNQLDACCINKAWSQDFGQRSLTRLCTWKQEVPIK